MEQSLFFKKLEEAAEKYLPISILFAIALPTLLVVKVNRSPPYLHLFPGDMSFWKPLSCWQLGVIAALVVWSPLYRDGWATFFAFTLGAWGIPGIALLWGMFRQKSR